MGTAALRIGLGTAVVGTACWIIAEAAWTVVLSMHGQFLLSVRLLCKVLPRPRHGLGVWEATGGPGGLGGPGRPEGPAKIHRFPGRSQAAWKAPRSETPL